MGWEKIKGEFLEYFTIREWTEAGIEIGFSIREGGKSLPPYDSLNLGLHVNDQKESVLKNRSIWFKEWNACWDDVVIGEQVHGNEVYWADASDGGKGSRSAETAIPNVDGLITCDNLGLMAFFADCVPLFFYHPEKNIVAIAHAGWKGTVLRIGEKIVREIEKKGGKAEDLWVGIGPAIGPCCYQIDKKVADRFVEEFGQGEWLSPDVRKKDCFRMDLVKVNQETLLKAGVLPSHLWVADLCTACFPKWFFSYRRDGKITGRMAGWIRRKQVGK